MVADLWHRGWHDAHPGHVPAGLTAARTLEAFHDRAPQRVADTTVAEVDGRVAGFVMVVDAEIEQVYVDREYRGAGVAGLLLREAERQVAGGGPDEPTGSSADSTPPRPARTPTRRFWGRHARRLG